MVILKISADTPEEREVEIVTERGLWETGIYKIFGVSDPNGALRESKESADKSDPDFLGEFNVNKENADWEYRGEKISDDEQKEIADFILDYQPPDGVY
ncbi:hypothetical protein [Mucilaginibacter glaciei]|uniref:Uncharacterized protein n=1 Tax=Mucilaginibacter glaciei TaxID=2772109 RepID=A0A926NUJ3_9SPHI|nr:hypothetical protein [Mucilaginibacter glaciei]MBD1391999.1 hypothetical protein [Mucilaginibacter glaciei]